MKRRLLLGIWYLSAVVCFFPSIAFSQTGEVGFSVEVVPHPNQKNDQVSYFDLLLSPSDETTLQVKLYNHMDEQQTFDLEIGNAYTNENGVVVYDQTKSIEGEVSLTELVDLPKQVVTVDAGATKVVTIPLKAIESEFEGSVLGGIRVFKQEEMTVSEGMGVNNRYQYVVGVKLATSLKQVPFQPEWQRVDVNLDNYYPHIGYAVRNETGTISGHLNVEMALTAKDGTTLRHTLDARMVPYTNTSFRFPIERRLEPGTYTATMTMTEEETNDTWTWTDTLEVTEEASAAIEERVEGPVVEQSSFFGTGWTVSVVTGLLVVCVSYIVYLRRKLIRSEEGRR